MSTTTKHFLHVAFNWKGGMRTKAVGQTLDRALDWVRYAPNCWIVYTSMSTSVWMNRLEKHLDAGDTLLVCQVDVEQASGRLPQWIWDWIAGKNQPK